jgi:hypothetical protein
MNKCITRSIIAGILVIILLVCASLVYKSCWTTVESQQTVESTESLDRLRGEYKFKSDDPFSEVKVKVINVKRNYKGEIYVQYVFMLDNKPSKDPWSDSFDRFNKLYERIN